ncbi:hypothetical protein CHU95_21895 [Niveispirillum lacus]|uniref:Uncharacterized protein n=1 Tax=Niveispirillum lacus TaxID=1981099 RepID=A0A255YTL8_9PROT|nr:hypothetical protein [Niveispirillum lacus]OYQ31780.1 hypothetical protein CHU95_21895 [Niveispirillum lacus]
MRILHFLGRLVRPTVPYPDLPDVILRDMDADLRAALEATARRHRRPFSFRIHPISELTEYRDRLFLATFPSFGDKSV